MTFSINNLKYSFNYYLTILLLFLFLYGIPFSFLPINSSKLVFLLLIPLFFFKSKLNFSFNIYILKILLFLLGMSFLSLLYSILYGTQDFSIFYAYLIFAIEALFGSYILYKLFLKKYTFEEILHIFIIVSLIQSIIIIGMFIFEPFRDFIFLISNSQEQLMQRYGGFRGFGLAGSVTYDLASFLSISMIFIAYLLSQSSDNRKFYLFCWVAIFIAVLMTGRTGWIGVFFSIIVFILNFKNINSLRSVGYLIFSIPLFSYIFILVLHKFFPDLYDVFFISVFPYAFEMFINYFETGSLSTASSDIVINRMYFKVSDNTLFFGDGYWRNPNGEGYYMSTDAGYMRHILFYGIFPSLLLYIFYLFSFIKMSFSLKRSFNNSLLFFVLCVYYFLSHYKGDFLTGSSMNIKLFSILLVYLVVSKNTLSLKYVDMKGSLN